MSNRWMLAPVVVVALLFTFMGWQFMSGGFSGLSAQEAQARITDPSPVVKTDAQWEKELTPEQYTVLRKQGTELPYSSKLLKEKRPGVFVCAACGKELYSSEHKFKSGTGWPSFYQPLSPASVGQKQDTSFGMKRTEVYCPRCGSHLGHVFTDGPKPTGLRHCINGAALKFNPK